jgi:hypothetical protein
MLTVVIPHLSDDVCLSSNFIFRSAWSLWCGSGSCFSICRVESSPKWAICNVFGSKLSLHCPRVSLRVSIVSLHSYQLFTLMRIRTRLFTCRSASINFLRCGTGSGFPNEADPDPQHCHAAAGDEVTRSWAAPDGEAGNCVPFAFWVRIRLVQKGSDLTWIPNCRDVYKMFIMWTWM